MLRFLISGLMAVFLLLASGCAGTHGWQMPWDETWVYPWQVKGAPQLGEVTRRVSLRFLDQESLDKKCSYRPGCYIRDDKGNEATYFLEREGWTGQYSLDLTVHYLPWKEFKKTCTGGACIQDGVMYVHDYAYWNNQGKLHYSSWGELIAQKLEIPERDLNVHCIIGHEVGFHQFGRHLDARAGHWNEPELGCF